MSLPQDFPRTELVIDDITGSDQFPDDLKVYAERWDDYCCLRRKWEGIGFCHWLFWCHNHQFECSISGFQQTWIKEKIKSILIDVEGRGDFLVQFWKPIDVEGAKGRGTTQEILTSRHQPFGLNSTNIALYAYAAMSRFHESDATSEQQHFGLLNRVFRSRRAECTTERRAHPIPPRAAAVDCKLTASLAFPLFEPWGGLYGVIEIVTNSDRLTNELYELFRNIVSKHADEEDPFGRQCIHLYEQNDKKEEALEEIKKSLEEVCRTHDIPLAHTWIPCRMCDALMLIHMVIKTLDGFLLHISTWRSITKEQGSVGKALFFNKLEFCEDVSASFAVPLRRRSSSLNEEDDIYVVEFLPNHVKFGDCRTRESLLLFTLGKHLKSVSIAFGDEMGKELPLDFFEENEGESVRLDSLNQGKENLPIEDNLVENGGETVRLDSANQEKEENAIAHVQNNNESCIEETNTTIMSSQQKVQHRKAGIPIPLELLQQHFGMKLKDAAESIDVSRSTLKRACREYGIRWWPPYKRKNKDNRSIPNKTSQCAAVEKQIGETSEAPISSPFGKQHTKTNISTELHEQDKSSVTIKVKFGAEEFIRFKLPVTSGMTEFQHQVEQRLHWKDGTYSVWYRDDDNDPVLVKIDEDLQDYICSSRAMGKNTVAVSLQPITNFPN